MNVSQFHAKCCNQLNGIIFKVISDKFKIKLLHPEEFMSLQMDKTKNSSFAGTVLTQKKSL
jgi:hypothetical protein